VHGCVGPDDLGISRRHGYVRHENGQWHVHNVGELPFGCRGSRLVLTGESLPLTTAYTPIFIRTSPGCEHLLETRIAGQPLPDGEPRHDQETPGRSAGSSARRSTSCWWCWASATSGTRRTRSR
jgi:hypothetical protein